MAITKKSIVAKKTAKSSPVKSKGRAGTLGSTKHTSTKVVAAMVNLAQTAGGGTGPIGPVH
jgi:hypothetical protein